MKTSGICTSVLLGLAVVLLFAVPTFGQTVPQPPFNQCPAVGLDTSCYILIWIDSTGSLRVLTDPSVSTTYDGQDDTLVGVQNDSSNAISSIPLQSPNTIFGFDGDGICSTTITPNPPGCPFPDPNQYGGPGVTFSSINAATTAGVVNFSPAIPASGGTAYFGLENAIQTQCPAVTLPTPPLFQDTPASVGNTMLGPQWSTVTIAQYGCYLTDLATEINYFAQKQGVSFRTDPVALNTYLASANGFIQCGNNGVTGLPCIDQSKQVKLVHDYAQQNGVTMYVGKGDGSRDDFTVDQYLCQGYPPMLWVGATATQSAHHWLVDSGQTTAASVATYSVQDPFSYTSGPANPYVAPYGNTLAVPVWGNTYAGYQLFSDNSQVGGGLYITAGGWFNWLTTTLSSLLGGGAVYDIVVTAPDGTQVGYNPTTSTSYRTIGGAGYTTNQIVDPASGNATAAVKYLTIPGATDGSYKIEIFGTGSGTYGLNVLSYDSAGNYTEVPLTGTVSAGSYESRTFSYSSVPKTSATVTLSNLTQTYSGSALAPSVTTTPANLGTTLYYNDQSNNPVVSPANAGTYTAVATINDPGYVGSTSGTFIINKAAATISLGNLSQAYNGSPLSPAVTTTPSGLATLLSYNGSSTAPTAPGTYNVAASISDPNYTGATTGVLTITYTFSASASGQSSATIKKGGTASYSITVTPPGGTTFPSEVDFSVTGLPAGATPSFSPQKIATGGKSTTVALSVATTTAIAANAHNRSGSASVTFACLLLPFASILVFRRRRSLGLARSLWAFIFVLALGCIALGLSACGGSGGSGGHTPKTYNFNVVATSGGVQQTVPLTLVVN